MKNLLKLSFLFLFFISCDKNRDDELKFNDKDFVSFEQITSTTVSIPENGGEAKIKVSISSPQSIETVINFDIVESVLNVGYTLASPSVVIPAGEVDGFLTIIPVDDALNTESTKLSATISSVSNNLKIGLREEGSYTKNIVIVNDDCPTKFNLWFGAISCEDVGYGATPGVGSSNANGDCDILKVDNDLPGAGGTAITNNFEFTLVPDSPGATTGRVLSQPTYMGDRNFNIGGVSTPCEMLYYNLNGTYDESTKKITIDYRMRIKAKSTGTLYNWYTGQNVISKP